MALSEMSPTESGVDQTKILPEDGLNCRCRKNAKYITSSANYSWCKADPTTVFSQVSAISEYAHTPHINFDDPIVRVYVLTY